MLETERGGRGVGTDGPEEGDGGGGGGGGGGGRGLSLWGFAVCHIGQNNALTQACFSLVDTKISGCSQHVGVGRGDGGRGRSVKEMPHPEGSQEALQAGLTAYCGDVNVRCFCVCVFCSSSTSDVCTR